MNEHNLEFYVPEGATMGEGPGHDCRRPAGQIRSCPRRRRNAKNKYSFLFPLRPGESRFNVVYTMPYTGSVNIDPKSVYPLEHFVAIAPKAMQFAPASDAIYKVAPFPGQPDANVEVASNTQPGQTMAFKLTGEGMNSPHRLMTMASPARKAPRSPPAAPAADSAPPSMLPILFSDIAGGFSEEWRHF